MKRLLSTEFTVGIFALVGLLIIIYMSLEVNDRNLVGGETKTYWARFDSVSGLIPRVRVEVSGIQVGFVDRIGLDGRKARITVRIRGDVKVHKDASLNIRDRGMLGDRFILLNPGSPDQPVLPEGGEITRTYSRSDFDRLLESLGETAEMVRDLVRSDEPEGALGDVVVNLRDMTGQLNNMVGENQDRINSILANFDSFSRDLSDISSTNKEQIRSVLVAMEDVAKTMRTALGEGGSIESSTKKFDETMASLQRIVAKVERGEGTIGKLVNDETTVNNINEAAEGLNETLGAYRKVQLGIRYRGEFLTGANELQNLIGISLAPSPDKFIMLEFVDAPVGETSVVDTVVTDGNGNVISQTETIQTNDDVLISFILGKRFWDLTFRFGLIRNKGGVGFDYHLWKDKFIVSVDAFDFSRVNDRAHLRTYGTLVLYNHLLLTGGVDDAITKIGSVNAFFGAGIQFTDRDLKALVTTGAAAF